MKSGESGSPEGVLGKRARSGTAANQSRIAPENEAAKRHKIPKGGRRGAALLKAAGVTAPSNNPAHQRATHQHHGALGEAPRKKTTQQKPSTTSATAAPNPLLHQLLPSKLQALKEIFIAVHTVYDMLRRRNRHTTYTNLKAAVEETCRRRFTETHLHQMQTLLPDYVTIDTINLAVAPHSTRTSRQTLITFLPETRDLSSAALRSLMHVRLAQHLLDAYGAHLRTRARELHAAGEPVEAAELEKIAQQRAPLTHFLWPFPEDVPDVGAALQNSSSTTTATATESGGGGRSTTMSTPRPVTSTARLSFSIGSTESKEQQQQHGGGGGGVVLKTVETVTPNDPLQPQMQTRGARRLSFIAVDKGDKTNGGGGGVKHQHTSEKAATVTFSENVFAAAAAAEKATTQAKVDADASAAALFDGLPEELRRRSLEGIISLQTMQVLDKNEVQHRRLSTQEARDSRDVSAALAALPQTFHRVQRIFGSRGPTAMKLPQVVTKVREGGAELISLVQIEAQLRCLAEHAPEFAQVKAWSGSDATPALWINRKCDGNAVVKKLKAVAQERLLLGSLQNPAAAAVAAGGGEEEEEVN